MGVQKIIPQPETLHIVERDHMGRVRTTIHTERRDYTFALGFAWGVWAVLAMILVELFVLGYVRNK